MLPNEIENHIAVLMENRPAHHGLWEGDSFNCSPENLSALTDIKSRGIENVTDRDVVFLFTSAASTVGNADTFRFFLPDFFNLLFFKREFGYSTDVEDIFNRLEALKIADWPKASQHATLALCLAGAELEQEEHTDFYDEEDEAIAHLIRQIKSALDAQQS